MSTKPARKRETINSRVIYNYHPMFAGADFTFLYGNDGLDHDPAADLGHAAQAGPELDRGGAGEEQGGAGGVRGDAPGDVRAVRRSGGHGAPPGLSGAPDSGTHLLATVSTQRPDRPGDAL